VSLAGFGVSDAFSRAKRALRTVKTSVVDAHEGRLDVGSATGTACHGDSGGPMLIDRGEGLRVAGVIHGAKAAICASPTEVVPVDTHRDWLAQAQAYAHASSSSSSAGLRRRTAFVLGPLLASSVLFALARLRRPRS
jgi:secreted trypsin-like serine protease